MTREARHAHGAWSRFARAFQSKSGSRWAWRALQACMGLAVLAPWLANERPYFARFRDTQGFAGRIKHRHMIEARRTARGGLPAGAVPSIERDVVMIAACRQENGAGASLHDLEAQHVAPKPQGAIDIGNLEMHVADTNARIDWSGRAGFWNE